MHEENEEGKEERKQERGREEEKEEPEIINGEWETVGIGTGKRGRKGGLGKK